MGRLVVLAAAVFGKGAELGPQDHCYVFLAAVPGGRFWLHLRGAAGCDTTEGCRRVADQCATVRVYGRRRADGQRGVCRSSPGPVSGDPALQPGRFCPSDSIGDSHYDVLGPVPAERGGDRGRSGGNVWQRRRAPLYLDGRRAGDANRLCAVLRLPERAGYPRGDCLVDARTGAEGRVNITNPIVPGFNPDPSIVRVGDDYYIATSTFEWYPGVQIHHSKDLVHWRLLTRPLNRPSQLNMLGDPDSCGIWAPCLTYADGLFWLIYTDVKRYGRTSQAGASGASLRDTHNYLVTSPQIDGAWSDPVYLNSSGFDPSLFHDDEGRKYLVNMRWDHRPGCNRFSGIVLQEYSPDEQRLIGPVQLIFQGTPLGFTAGPHLYKRNGYY